MKQDQQAVRDVLDAFALAVHDGDARAAIATYSDDVIAYHLAPPLVQPPAMVRDREGLEAWFATWAGPVDIATGDMTVEVDGDLAVAWSLRHMTGVKTNGGAQSLWFRSTVGLRRRKGNWKIAHVHDSVPFAMDGTGKALLNLNPEET